MVPPKINPWTSWYLDLLRASAAVLVLLSHAGHAFFSHGLFWTPAIGHQMVVVFFVLSGFVMSHAVTKVQSDWRTYASSRFSRIASVAYPALILTILCDFVGRQIAPELYLSVARQDGYWGRILVSAIFMQQSGPLAASPGSNTPYWSLAYEVWYYVFLGLWVFVPSGRKRFCLCLIAIMLAGPKILLLMPVWLAGVLAYKSSARVRLRSEVSGFLCASSACLLATILCGYVQPFGYAGEWQASPPWFFSNGFLADYQIGLLVAIHVFGLDQLVRRGGSHRIWEPLNRMVRFLANRSFSLYAYHMPLLYLVSVWVPYNQGDSLQVASALVLVVSIILTLHWVTERRRHVWYRWAQAAIGGLPANKERPF